MTLGAHIPTLRVERGLSLDDVAAATGSSKSTLSRIERGKLEPGIVLCAQLSVLLRVSITKLAAAAMNGSTT